MFFFFFFILSAIFFTLTHSTPLQHYIVDNIIGIKTKHRTHYVEYLVTVVYQAKLDPLPILDLTDCVQELRRRGIILPERGPWDTDPIYREMCQKVNYFLI